VSAERELIEELVVEDPITHSVEGLDDKCLFCCENLQYLGNYKHRTTHSPRCAWIVGMRYLGRPIGDEHKVWGDDS
jgi:hypothetical protein